MAEQKTKWGWLTPKNKLERKIFKKYTQHFFPKPLGGAYLKFLKDL